MQIHAFCVSVFRTDHHTQEGVTDVIAKITRGIRIPHGMSIDPKFIGGFFSVKDAHCWLEDQKMNVIQWIAEMDPAP